VVSELRKGERCHPGVAAWFERISTEEIFFSVLTVGEIRQGIEKLRPRDIAAAAVLETWLTGLVTVYADRILSIDQSVAEQWGHFNVPDRKAVVDCLLAATAKVHDLTLVTRNLKDVERTGVRCIDPFSSVPS
jgi:predicted nucleic acid-binding protein